MSIPWAPISHSVLLVPSLGALLALAIECIHKQLSHILSTLPTKSQKSRRNVLDVNADAVPAQRVRRVDH